MDQRSPLSLAPVQLSFELTPSDPFAIEYFVRHSGVRDVVNGLERAVEEVVREPGVFLIAVIIGPEGSGKSHLARALARRAEQSGLPAEQVGVIELDVSPLCAPGENSSTGEFVAKYEALKRSGGVMFVVSRNHPSASPMSPHVRSRLLAGRIVELGLPKEEDLAEIVEVLFRRQNIRISPQSVKFLVSRLPAIPLSFARISAKIEYLSSLLGRPVRYGFVRDVVTADSLKP